MVADFHHKISKTVQQLGETRTDVHSLEVTAESTQHASNIFLKGIRWLWLFLTLHKALNYIS